MSDASTHPSAGLAIEAAPLCIHVLAHRSGGHSPHFVLPGLGYAAIVPSQIQSVLRATARQVPEGRFRFCLVDVDVHQSAKDSPWRIRARWSRAGWSSSMTTDCRLAPG